MRLTAARHELHEYILIQIICEKNSCVLVKFACTMFRVSKKDSPNKIGLSLVPNLNLKSLLD